MGGRAIIIVTIIIITIIVVTIIIIIIVIQTYCLSLTIQPAVFKAGVTFPCLKVFFVICVLYGLRIKRITSFLQIFVSPFADNKNSKGGEQVKQLLMEVIRHVYKQKSQKFCLISIVFLGTKQTEIPRSVSLLRQGGRFVRWVPDGRGSKDKSGYIVLL